MSRQEALAMIETLVDKREDDLIDLRRDLHAHPELSWEERRSSDVVSHHLDGLGWRVTRTGESFLSTMVLAVRRNCCSSPGLRSRAV